MADLPASRPGVYCLSLLLAGLYSFVGLVGLLNHRYYLAGFWGCLGLVQVAGLLARRRPVARRWLIAAQGAALLAGLLLLALHLRHDLRATH